MGTFLPGPEAGVGKGPYFTFRWLFGLHHCAGSLLVLLLLITSNIFEGQISLQRMKLLKKSILGVKD